MAPTRRIKKKGEIANIKRNINITFGGVELSLRWTPNASVFLSSHESPEPPSIGSFSIIGRLFNELLRPRRSGSSADMKNSRGARKGHQQAWARNLQGKPHKLLYSREKSGDIGRRVGGDFRNGAKLGKLVLFIWAYKITEKYCFGSY